MRSFSTLSALALCMMAADTARGVAPMAAEKPEVPEGFVSLGLDRLFYKPEKCMDVQRTLRGYLKEANVMGHDGENGPFTALVFELTEDCVAVAGDTDDAEVVQVKAGDEIMIVATEKLQKLIQYANHPTQMAEFVITVLGKINLKGKKTMWRYHVAGGKPVPRPTATELFAELTAGVNPAGNGAPLPGRA